MTDYISRQYLLDEYDRQHQGPPGGARKIIAEAPAEDVVQVVRCKVCRKHSYDPLFGYWWCNLTLGTRRVKPDDFCSYGERKEE